MGSTNISRRRSLAALFACGAWAVLRPRALFGKTRPLLQVDRLIEGLSPSGLHGSRRVYRADAVILVFSLSVYRHTGVGIGVTRIEESVEGNKRRTLFEFAAGSLPDRTRGLNRMGFLREVAIVEDTRLAETAYFGALVSGANDEDLEHARKSLDKPNRDEIVYKAIDGGSAAGLSRSAVTRFGFSSRYHWPQRDALAEAARSNFSPEQTEWRETKWAPAAEVPGSFLHALMTAAKLPQQHFEGSYVYGEKRYKMKLDKTRDEKATRDFAARGLIPGTTSVFEIRGKTTQESNGKQNTFQLWMEDTPEVTLPLRFEYQPRPFLRLAFEFDPILQHTPTGKEDV